MTRCARCGAAVEGRESFFTARGEVVCRRCHSYGSISDQLGRARAEAGDAMLGALAGAALGVHGSVREMLAAHQAGREIDAQQHDLREEFAREQELRAMALARYHRAMGRVMILAMLADGVIDAREVGRICEIMEQVTGRPLDAELVRQEAASYLGAPYTVATVVGAFPEPLSREGAVALLQAAQRVALADGALVPQERQLLVELGGALGLGTAAELERFLDGG